MFVGSCLEIESQYNLLFASFYLLTFWFCAHERRRNLDPNSAVSNCFSSSCCVGITAWIDSFLKATFPKFFWKVLLAGHLEVCFEFFKCETHLCDVFCWATTQCIVVRILFDLPLEYCFLRRCRGYYLNDLRCLDLGTLHKFELFLVDCENWFLKLPEVAFPKLTIVFFTSASSRFVISYDRLWNMFAGASLGMESHHTWLFACFSVLTSCFLCCRETVELDLEFSCFQWLCSSCLDRITFRDAFLIAMFLNCFSQVWLSDSLEFCFAVFSSVKYICVVFSK